MKDSKIEVNGIDLHVVDYGGEGETIICVHGLTANCRFWDCIAEQFIDQYRVIAFDLRGRGDSAKPVSGYNIQQHAEDVKGILEHYEIEKAIYVGHSLGAMIGACFAATYPDRLRSLILIDGGADVEPNVSEILRPAIGRLGKVSKSFNAYTDELKAIPFFKDWNSYIEQYFYFDVIHNEDGSVVSKVSKNAIVQEMNALLESNVNQFHKKIKTPTLLLWAPQSLYHPTAYIVTKEKGEEMVHMIPNSKFVPIKESNHYSIVLNEYEDVAREIKKFLAGE
ncbi:alpha/beta fold hydrolase [Anaerobacillus sp. MEB173]|uniref:alpha/beta fold hydrolase n=1 Tax=Anaerobacillus sp. MEB173 TaxID=3383345 RepID=UPI003F9268D9